MMRNTIFNPPFFLVVMSLFLASCDSKKEMMIEVYETYKLFTLDSLKECI